MALVSANSITTEWLNESKERENNSKLQKRAGVYILYILVYSTTSVQYVMVSFFPFIYGLLCFRLCGTALSNKSSTVIILF
jgi:hypothetical protein